jgi:hypothetical protein
MGLCKWHADSGPCLEGVHFEVVGADFVIGALATDHRIHVPTRGAQANTSDFELTSPGLLRISGVPLALDQCSACCATHRLTARGRRSGRTEDRTGRRGVSYLDRL